MIDTATLAPGFSAVLDWVLPIVGGYQALTSTAPERMAVVDHARRI